VGPLNDTAEAVLTLADTHGLVTRDGTRIWATSETLGWRALFSTAQQEAPFDDEFRPVRDHLVVVHMTGPVRVTRRLAGREETRLVPQGGAFIMPGGVGFGVRLQGGLDTLHFYLHRPIVDEIAAELADGGGAVQIIPCLGDRDPLLEQIAIELREQLRDSSLSTALYVDHLARAAAARLLRAHSTATLKATEVRRGGLSDRQLRRTVDYIEENIERDPTLSELASLAGLSPVYFARQFRRTTGVAPHQYLLRARVERAKRLLASGDLPVAAVAIDCGFCHQEHLTRVFRKFCGTTPGAYRLSLRS
jgi:AraC family transcriptional regulator